MFVTSLLCDAVSLVGKINIFDPSMYPILLLVSVFRSTPLNCADNSHYSCRRSLQSVLRNADERLAAKLKTKNKSMTIATLMSRRKLLRNEN